MSLARDGIMSRRWANSTARRRAHARYRAHLIRLLGWIVEDLADRYVASTGELRTFLVARI